MRQIGVRDEAKLLADYGDCGKPVCCNTHLSEMPPVSMKMAKLQRATLDPSKISGRCGRLKCCLRYEYDTYQELQRELPPVGRRHHHQQRPGPRAGPGNPRRPGARRNRGQPADRHRRGRRAHRAQARKRRGVAPTPPMRRASRRPMPRPTEVLPDELAKLEDTVFQDDRRIAAMIRCPMRTILPAVNGDSDRIARIATACAFRQIWHLTYACSPIFDQNTACSPADNRFLPPLVA